MTKEQVLRVLEEDVYPISGMSKTSININNSGTLNREKLEKEKRFYFRYLTEHIVDEVIKETQHYPHDDISDVDLDADFVIMDAEVFASIKQFVESLFGIKDLMNHE